ncbi:GEL complex subunit OPTI-like [Hydractinia symbiolongicarpus]|uniref:GEL complex subunit OPTI-like n=1 Tax=Hydractinia symbiolongicarpus TaxID=13093 RepID=UPI00254C95B8|nr:GEL complex subunit OPTI-like [Hydractinia symbiolongicarpus]
MSKRKGGTNSQIIPAKSNVADLFKKSLTIDAAWDEKDDLLDVIYWMRQVFAVINGIAWGLIPLQGILGLGLFFAINCAIVYIYISKFQKIDEDDYGGIQEILKEGLFTAFAVFLVCWIMIYTGLHG